MATRPTDGAGARDTPPEGDVDPGPWTPEAGVAMAAIAASEFDTRHGDYLQGNIATTLTNIFTEFFRLSKYLAPYTAVVECTVIAESTY